MTTFYCGYCIAYIAALRVDNLTLIYGQLIGNANIRACCLSCVPYGVTLGTFIAIKVVPMITRRYFLLFKYRKLTFILACCGILVEGVIQVDSLIAFFICRFLQGTITGMFLFLVPIYIRELSPK
jgi:hypothetical protein